jgi:hypothetical protein
MASSRRSFNSAQTGSMHARVMSPTIEILHLASGFAGSASNFEIPFAYTMHIEQVQFKEKNYLG